MERIEFALNTGRLPLEAGGEIGSLRMAGTWAGPDGEREIWEARARGEASSLDPTVPTVLAVHALTGDARVSGPDGWWSGAVGPGLAIDTRSVRVLCFNNLGSCYGSTGPTDPEFPGRTTQPPPPATSATLRGYRPLPRESLPATVTTWDQARAILQALDVLGVDRVHLATGGSLGGMIVMCLAVLDPERFERIVPFAAAPVSTPWILGWNHIARQAILADPDFPGSAHRGLAIARQIAHMTYRAEPGLVERQGRDTAGSDRWNPALPYRVETYLDVQGDKLVARFDARSYLATIDAMDHHDIERDPRSAWRDAPAPAPWLQRALDATVWGTERVESACLAVGIDTDMLYFPDHGRVWAERLLGRGVPAAYQEIRSLHGHDAFLLEWDQVGEALRRAAALPALRRSHGRHGCEQDAQA